MLGVVTDEWAEEEGIGERCQLGDDTRNVPLKQQNGEREFGEPTKMVFKRSDGEKSEKENTHWCTQCLIVQIHIMPKTRVSKEEEISQDIHTKRRDNK